MPRALLCPKCKSVMPIPPKMPRYGTNVNVFCKKCDENVDALVIQLDKESIELKEGDLDPTEQDKEEVEALSSMPLLSSIYVIGDSLEVVKFLIIRTLAFALLFFFTGSGFLVSFSNPAFLILGSSVSVAVMHLLYILRPASSSGLALPWGLALILLGLLPLVVFEVLLFAVSLLYVLVEVGVALISVALIKERHKGAIC